MSLPEQLLLSDLLRLRVRCRQGLDHGTGLMGWMHPPVHRLLGWVSRPSAFGSRRLVWRLDQLRGLNDQEAFVQGDPAETDPATLDRLPTLLEAVLRGDEDLPLGTVADAAVDLRTGRIRHYLVARSDPRLPGSSRWRLDPDRIVDQRPGEVRTALRELDDLPLARASVRQQFLRRSRRWREQFEQVGGSVEQRLEGWLEEPPWDEGQAAEPAGDRDWDRDRLPDPLEDWPEDESNEEGPLPEPRRPHSGRPEEDPWV